MSTPPRLRNPVVLAAGLLLFSTRASAADRQARSFIGATFSGATTVVDPEDAVKQPSITLGGSAVFLGEILGAEVEVADSPGFFEAGKRNLVTYSRVTTVTGSIVIAAPHRMTEYALRPYVVAGAGFIRMRSTTSSDVFNVASTVPAFDVGVGAVGFLTNRVGVCWDLRRLQDVGRNRTNEPGLSFDQQQEQHLSFWRATMAVVFRY
jgi:hypothetical protein